jgi:ferrous iron transport protein A
MRMICICNRIGHNHLDRAGVAARVPLAPSVSASLAMNLSQLPLSRAATIADVEPPPGAPEWARWLAEIGFVPGEAVSVMARGIPGGDPLVVRIGDSTFALRRAEAACIQVHPIQPGPRDA